jgi:hypothetical protein
VQKYKCSRGKRGLQGQISSVVPGKVVCHQENLHRIIVLTGIAAKNEDESSQSGQRYRKKTTLHKKILLPAVVLFNSLYLSISSSNKVRSSIEGKRKASLLMRWLILHLFLFLMNLSLTSSSDMSEDAIILYDVVAKQVW